MFSLRVTETTDVEAVFGASSQSPFDRLAQRTPINYDAFIASLEARQGSLDRGESDPLPAHVNVAFQWIAILFDVNF